MPHMSALLLVALLATQSSAAQTAGNARATQSSVSREFAALIEQAGSEDRTRRYRASIELRDRVSAEHASFLEHTALHHRSGRVRGQAVALLGHLRVRKSIQSLGTVLRRDKSHWVRREAARALRKMRSPAVRSVLIQALGSDEDASVRKWVACALGRIVGQKSLEGLEAALKNEADSEVRSVIREALERRQQPRQRPARLVRGEVTEGFHQGTRYLLYVPNSYQATTPPPLLISVHGTHGRPEGYMDICLPDAEKRGLVVLAPHFDYGTFPDFGNLNPWLGWDRADLRLLSIVDDIAKKVRLRKERFYIFGHSQGAQFVHRFVLVHPLRVRRAAACAGGNYVQPESDTVFPWGTKLNPLMADVEEIDFAALVTTPLAIVIGTEDLQRRQDQANRFMRRVRAYAAEHNLACRIEFFSVPGGPHAGRRNYPLASTFLFAGSD